MELQSLGQSVLKLNETLNEKEGSSTEVKPDEQEIVWKSEISKEKAVKSIAEYMYPFKKVHMVKKTA
jgi:hypothetical protein